MGKQLTDKRNPIPMVVAGALIMLILGSMNAWSMFSLYISKDFPQFTAAQMSATYTITIMVFSAGCFIGASMANKISTRSCIRIAGLMIGAGFIALSFMPELSGGSARMLMYAGFGGLVGFGDGIAYTLCVATISIRFKKRASLISGVLLMHFGIGSMLIASLAEMLALRMGIFRVFMIYGVIIGVAVVVLASFLWNDDPAQETEQSSEVQTADAVKSYSPMQMVKTSVWWAYLPVILCTYAIQLLMVGSAAGMAVWFGAAASVGMLTSITNSVSRPVSGILVDKLGVPRFSTLLLTVQLAVCAVLVVAGFFKIAALGIIGIIASGICYGGVVVFETAAVRTFFGPKHYTTNLSISICSGMPASLLGTFAGVLQDRSGGSFESTFVMVLIVAVIASVSGFFMCRTLAHRDAALQTDTH